MSLEQFHVLITEGAGFVGSRFVDRLMSLRLHVVVFDNLSAGRLKKIEKWLEKDHFKLVKGYLRKPKKVDDLVEEVDLASQLAAMRGRLDRDEYAQKILNTIMETFLHA